MSYSINAMRDPTAETEAVERDRIPPKTEQAWDNYSGSGGNGVAEFVLLHNAAHLTQRNSYAVSFHPVRGRVVYEFHNSANSNSE